MLRLLKRCSWVGLLALGLQPAGAYSLLGPINEAYQVSTIGYNLPGDLGAPKNLGEEYRRNTPVLYYSFDQSFLDYFGSNGVYAVEQAFAILNGLTNVSSYSTNLSEFPLEAQQHNYQADALALLDVKSALMSLLMENLGLAEPDRFTWTLHNRFLPSGGTCPQDETYLVIKRNFDPVISALDQLQASSYVNGTLYSYFIAEFCSGVPDPLAEAVEFPVDPLNNIFTAVASFGLDEGGFYTGLTRDDVGGLRYLLSAGNRNIEDAGPNTQTISTNYNTSQLLFTSNLTLLASQSLTNDAAALLALYPDLVISSTTLIFTNLVTTNVSFYFTNLPAAPVGSPATLVSFTTRTTNVTTWFNRTFANVITNSFSTNGFVTVQTTTVGPCPIAPAGTVCTNVSQTTVLTNIVMGDYYILPTNSPCGVLIVSTQFTGVVTITNDIVTATNSPGTTNVNDQQFSQSILTYFTNNVFVIHPVACLDPGSVALREGIERITFVRRDFDSLLGQFFVPITNQYILAAVTNNTRVPQVVLRRVAQPDILIGADDLAAGPNALPLVSSMARNVNFNANNAYAGLAGPGTIETSTRFTYNKVGPIYDNPGFFFFGTQPPFTEATHSQRLVWGSFDGSTNAPVVYPNGTSIVNLENQVLIQVEPSTPVTNGVIYLPNGTVGSGYAGVFSGFTVTGGQTPYVWSLSPGSPGLPPGLFLSPAGAILGAPANGTAGLTFDFMIRLTDAGSRFVDRPYAITINP